jgi:hypothetical protein
VIRSGFARLGHHLDTTVYSDRRVPERRLRPPATRLLRSRGCTLQFFLTALFEAQCHTRPGRVPGPNRRPLKSPPNALEQASWVDLVAVSADTVLLPPGSRWINDRERRARQIRQALQTLATDDVPLIEFTDLGAARHYHSFGLLHEAGRRALGNPVPYAVPRATEPNLFSLDARMFTNGWANILEDTELAFLLMVADLQARAGSNDPVPVPGDDRVGYYCLGTDGYQAYHVLERAGLLRVERPRGRLRDGTFRGLAVDFGSSAPHRFRILSDGFDRPALPAVIRALQRP